jgi:hypothetical protein
MLRKFLFAALFPVAACQVDAPHFHLPGDDDSTIDGSIDSTPGPDADCALTCNGPTLTNPCTGEMTTCDLGCENHNGSDRCNLLIPSNGIPSSLLDGVTADFVVTATNSPHTLDTDTGHYDGLTFPGATTLSGAYRVFAADSITIEAGATLEIFGAKAAVLLSRGDVVIGGTVDAAAHTSGGSTCFDGNLHASCPGPGGGFGGEGANAATGCGPGVNGFVGGGNGRGGGGGAMVTAGGDSGTSNGTFAAGGTTTACPQGELLPLVGGSGGGRSSTNSATPGAGGAGGGGLQITSLASVSITTGAIIDVTGDGGYKSPDAGTGGGAGGSGGNVLVEGLTVSIATDGSVYAGGGGGACGDASGTGTSPPLDGDGDPGQRSLGPAAGGGTGSVKGGFGGTASAAPTDGDPAAAPLGTAGGGGSAGRLRVNATLSHAPADGSFPRSAYYSIGVETTGN